MKIKVQKIKLSVSGVFIIIVVIYYYYDTMGCKPTIMGINH